MQLHTRRMLCGPVTLRQPVRALPSRAVCRAPSAIGASGVQAPEAAADVRRCCSDDLRSEIVSFGGHPDAIQRRAEATARRHQRQAETQELQQLRSEWWRMRCPRNLLTVDSREEYIAALERCKACNGLVVVDFFSPSCYGCRMLYPKLRQIAANNLDVAFIKVNTESEEMQNLAAELGVTGLPYFNLHAGAKVEAFAANLSKVGRLREEISALKQAVSGQGEKVLQSA